MSASSANRIADHHFEELRSSVLSNAYASGLNTQEVKSFLSSLPKERFAGHVLLHRGNRLLLQPRGGFPTFEKQRKLTQELSKAGADFLPLTIDSLTRNNKYDKAEALLQACEQEGTDFLNGFPLVNHGHRTGRLLYENIDKPISLRHGTADAKLLVEMAIASGITEIEGGGLCYSIPYSSNFPIDLALLNWQYVDRLCAEYSTPERPLHRESFGPLSATLVPPAMVVAIQILELLLAAEQGVTSFSYSFGQMGTFEQDVAVAQALRELSKTYLEDLTFSNVNCFLVYHHWMGAFPYDKKMAAGLISMASVTASLIGADKVVVKTVDEAFGIPTTEANADAVRLCRYISKHFSSASNDLISNATEEQNLVKQEATEILDAILNLSNGPLWERVSMAVKRGFIDIPFTPHKSNSNSLLTKRDHSRNIRIVDAGQVPLSQESTRRESDLLNSAPSQPDLEGEHSQKPIQKLLNDINLMV